VVKRNTPPKPKDTTTTQPGASQWDMIIQKY
jgi:hypothetical protein